LLKFPAPQTVYASAFTSSFFLSSKRWSALLLPLKSNRFHHFQHLLPRSDISDGVEWSNRSRPPQNGRKKAPPAKRNVYRAILLRFSIPNWSP